MARTAVVVRRPGPPTRNPSGDRSVGPEVRRLAQAAARILREDGVTAVAQNALAVAGVRRLVVFCRSTDVLRRETPVPADVDVRAVTEATVDAYTALRPDTRLDAVLRRLHAGDLCIGAWRGDRLLSARWLARDRAELPYLRVSFALGGEVRYAYDAFTDFSERRNGLGVIVTNELIRTAASEGATSVINGVLPENRGGMGLARRDPPIGMLRTVGLGRRLLVVSNLPPGFLDDPRAL